VYTTVRLFAASFDWLIDRGGEDMEPIARFCRELDIPNIYHTREGFIACYCFGDKDPNSIQAWVRELVSPEGNRPGGAELV